MLIEDLEAEREWAALVALPYDDDPDLAWEALPGAEPDLPDDGEVPKEVVQLARQRGRQRA